MALSDTVTVYGLVVGPLAGAVLATTGALPDGYYRVGTFFATSGVSAAVDSDNVGVVVAGVQRAVQMGIQGTPAVSATEQVRWYSITGGGTVSLVAIAAATSTAGYHVEINCTRIGGAS